MNSHPMLIISCIHYPYKSSREIDDKERDQVLKREQLENPIQEKELENASSKQDRLAYGKPKVPH